MSKRNRIPEEEPRDERAALPMERPEALDNVIPDAPAETAQPGPAGNSINLFADEQYEVLPNVPRNLIFLGDTIDLVRLTPGQYRRITTTEAGKRIVRKR